MKKLLMSILLSALLFSACSPGIPDVPVELETPRPQPTPLPETYQVLLQPYIPNVMQEMVLSLALLEPANSSDSHDFLLDVSSSDADIYWVYALCAPFSYIGGGVSSTLMERFWSGESADGFPAEAILVDGSTAAVFEKLWGMPDRQRVQEVSSSEILTQAWESENVFAILPFENLQPAWQVLTVDGLSPVWKDFDQQTYPLSVPFAFIGSPSDLVGLHYQLAQEQIVLETLTNRRADKLTTVITTGVTALVRGTAFIMEASGMTYPAIDIGDILREADILHINNEVPFAENCPRPFANPENDANMIFCSRPEYILLLEAIGTDVVELAGDHFWNWGEAAMFYSIDLYEQRGWQIYGGGRNYADGVEPALFEHNGNRIAFLGCNAKPPGYATASESYPGAVGCDLDLMQEKIAEALDTGYLPIFTFQHTEYYSYKASESLRKDFVIVADAGAVIVQGSQAHQPHAMEFYKNVFMHYGLGNLFFDQYYESAAQREAFLDRHIFYDGKYISTELITIQFIDNARPRLMTDVERETLLTKVFTASGW